MEKQVPSIGRIVVFENPNNNGAPSAAIIVAVNNEENVNLVAWDSIGNQSAFTSVSIGEGLGRWNWPKYVAPKKVD